jgi:hypothetical protein
MSREAGTRSPLAVALAIVVLVVAAMLVMLLTLPLLSHSAVEFAVAATLSWLAIFAGAVAVSRAVSLRGREAVAERPESVLNDTLADGRGLDGVAAGTAQLEKGTD